MLLSNKHRNFHQRLLTLIMGAGLLMTVSACQFKPLYGNASVEGGYTNSLSGVRVGDVNTRVAQQVRNHLLFLLNGGSANSGITHEARLSVSWSNRQLSVIDTEDDATAGTVTVIARYDLIDANSGKSVASGTRQANASYDRTGQVFANTRAERDAENRAAREVAESLRLAIASDLNR